MFKHMKRYFHMKMIMTVLKTQILKVAFIKAKLYLTTQKLNTSIHIKILIHQKNK